MLSESLRYTEAKVVQDSEIPQATELQLPRCLLQRCWQRSQLPGIQVEVGGSAEASA